ncbi:phage tail protein [Shewanella sp. D64]|uniref:phage tail-collar fiber domain-containing protein n=1 Tax=unclassified Shewanella TaxID=196818 RepID=UPI0022BA6B45|nr:MULTISPECIES: phage tail protein [unclassified Shewanella]MEC4725861.1 phage tail protein [Shewanella sp. D64]WBJ95692.1 phage tail protein [Shewanella sp. MTB7]
MSQNIIPTAFEQYRQHCELNKTAVVLDTIILANIPGLDPEQPVDRDQISYLEDWVVHRHKLEVNQITAINHNAVAYALLLDTRVGDFSFNAMFLINSIDNVIAMAIYKGVEDKLASTPGQTGNSIVKTMIMPYSGAAAATHISVSERTWTIDYAKRLAGLMQDERLSNIQSVGNSAFVGDAFLFQDNQLMPGVAYIKGVRVDTDVMALIPDANKSLIIIDVWQAGTATGAWESDLTVIQSNDEPVDYIDEAGVQHYCAVLAERQGDRWLDRRQQTLLEEHKQHNDPHTQYIAKVQISQDDTNDNPDTVPSSAVTAGLKSRLDLAISIGQGMVLDLGPYDASSGEYPPKPYVTDNDGNGQLVSAFWFVTQAGVINDIGYEVNDKINYSRVTDAFFKTDNTETLSLSQAESLFARVMHDHQWAQIKGIPVQATRWPSWTEVSGKPATMPPSSHIHTWVQITGIPVYATRWPSKSEVGLSVVNNWGATGSVTDTSDVKYATAGAVQQTYVHATDARNRAINAHIRADSAYNLASGKANASHAHTWGQISGIPVYATRWPSKSEVGLSVVNNWGATDSVSDTSDVKYATAGAVQQTYAHATDARTRAINAHTRADSAYSLASGKANASHSHTWGQISGIPVYATRWANKSEVGLSAVNNWGASTSVSSTSTTTYATSSAVKAAYDRGTAGINAANGKAAAIHEHHNRTVSKTTLWSGVIASSGSTVYTLSQPWSNYDAIAVVGTNDSATKVITSLITVDELNEIYAIAGTSKHMELLRGSEIYAYWIMADTSKKKFRISYENSRVLKIIGINYSYK